MKFIHFEKVVAARVVTREGFERAERKGADGADSPQLQVGHPTRAAPRFPVWKEDQHQGLALGPQLLPA